MTGAGTVELEQTNLSHRPRHHVDGTVRTITDPNQITATMGQVPEFGPTEQRHLSANSRTVLYIPVLNVIFI